MGKRPMTSVPLAGVLPEELMLVILLKVPARVLVGLRRVCKSWNDLIRNPQFAITHFNHNNTTQQLLFIGYCKRYVRKSLSLFSLNQQPQTLFRVNTKVGQRLDFPQYLNFPDLFKECFFAGSINGIICLSSFKESCNHVILFRPWVVLWNPAINHWKVIPTLPQKSGDDTQHTSISLAFDSHNSDYKIIRLVCLDSHPLPESRIEIYSSNQDSWIHGTTISYSTSNLNSTVIVKGVPYWSKNYRDVPDYGNDSTGFYQSVFIAAIDPHTGLYKKIKYPPAVKNPFIDVLPFSLMDSLAIITCLPSNYSNRIFNVYALDQTCDTWNKAYAFTPTLLQNKNISIIRCFEDAGKTILVGWDQDHWCSILYDPKTDSFCHSIGMDAFQPKWVESYHHVESLFSVNGMKPIPREDNSNHKRGPPSYQGRELAPFTTIARGNRLFSLW